MNARILAAGVAGLLVSATLASAQGAPPPRDTARAAVGGKQVSVEYGKPALKDRKIDDLLKQLPADRMWRAGVNQVTTLTAEGDVLVGGKKLAAGKYSLYVYAPATGDYQLAVNSDLGVALGKIYAQAPDNLKNEPWPYLQDYDKNIGAKEVLRVPMKKSSGKPTDLFTVAFTPSGNGQTLWLSWGDRSWSVDITPAK